MDPILTANQISAIDIWMILPLFVVGSVLHFVYNWSHHSKGIAVLAAVNESYWEHIKIAFWPVFFLYVGEFFLGGYAFASFIPSRTIALYAIPITMVSTVFLYKHFARKNILWIDISLFMFTIIVAQVVSTLYIDELMASRTTVIISWVFLSLLATAFFVFTLNPPKEPDLFKDPITEKYGVKGHK